MYRIIVLSHFKKGLKPLLKRYGSLRAVIFRELERFDFRQHKSLGGGVYKMRITTPEIRKGKNKSFRLVVLVIEVERYLVPITLYYKGDLASITERELRQHLRSVYFELRLRRFL